MVYYGHGFSWTELYNMPIWLRKFYLKKVLEAKKSEQKEHDDLKSKMPKVSNSKRMVRK
jgi:hypothetical protein